MKQLSNDEASRVVQGAYIGFYNCIKGHGKQL